MANEVEGSNTEQSKGEGPKISIFLRIFILLNILLLAGVAAWWVQGFMIQSSAEAKRKAAEQTRTKEQMIASNPSPSEASELFADPVTYVIDASSREKWIHFNFLKKSIFSSDKIAVDSADWDIVFCRAKILTNGGASGKLGKAEVAAIVGTSFEKVDAPPKEGYYKDLPTENIQENTNPALEKWYNYDFLTHKLRPRDVVYVMKTAAGDYLKFTLNSYYCADMSGCYTIKYQFLIGGEGQGAPTTASAEGQK